jgi:arylamine N-acetyltransferase
MEEPYVQDAIPTILKQYFASLEQSNGNKELLQQWQDYLAPMIKQIPIGNIDPNQNRVISYLSWWAIKRSRLFTLPGM